MGELTVEDGGVGSRCAGRTSGRRPRRRSPAPQRRPGAERRARACPRRSGSSRRWWARSTARRRPTSRPFVDEGDRVEVGQTLCILEAMKLFNEFKSDHAGVIRRRPGRQRRSRSSTASRCSSSSRSRRDARAGADREPGGGGGAARARLPRSRHRGRGGVLDRRPRRPVGAAGRPGGLRRPAPAGPELPERLQPGRGGRDDRLRRGAPGLGLPGRERRASCAPAPTTTWCSWGRRRRRWR